MRRRRAAARFRAWQRRRRARRDHGEFQGRARLGFGANRRRRQGRGAGGGQCGRQRHGRRRAVVLGGAVRMAANLADAECRRRSRRTCWRAPQGRPGRDAVGKHHAGGGRYRRGSDETAGKAAGDDRADRNGPRDLSGACAAGRRRGVCGRDRRRSRSIRCSASPNSAWSPPIGRPRHRTRRLSGDRAALSGRAAGLEGSFRLGRCSEADARPGHLFRR